MSERKSNLMLLAEVNERNKFLTHLNTLDGYKTLSSRQKRLISASLYSNQRAHRGYVPNRNYKSSWDSKYSNSQKVWGDWYCAAAMIALENKTPLVPIDQQKIEYNFFDADYHYINNFFELENFLKEVGFPQVVHVTNTPQVRTQDDWYHSFLTLGIDSSEKILAWDKQNFDLPFRVIDIAEIYQEYPYAQYWGTRELKAI